MTQGSQQAEAAGTPGGTAEPACHGCKKTMSEDSLKACPICHEQRCAPCMAKHWLEADGQCSQFTQVAEVNWARTALQVRQQQYKYDDVSSEVAAAGLASREGLLAGSTWQQYVGKTLCFYSMSSGGGTTFVPCQEPVMNCQVCHVQPLCKRCYRNAERRPSAGDLMACSRCPAYCHKGCTQLPGSASSGSAYEQPPEYELFQKFLCRECAEAKVAANAVDVPVPPWRTHAQNTNKKTSQRQTMRGAHYSDKWDTVDQPPDEYEQ